MKYSDNTKTYKHIFYQKRQIFAYAWFSWCNSLQDLFLFFGGKLFRRCLRSSSVLAEHFVKGVVKLARDRIDLQLLPDDLVLQLVDPERDGILWIEGGTIFVLQHVFCTASHYHWWRSYTCGAACWCSSLHTQILNPTVSDECSAAWFGPVQSLCCQNLYWFQTTIWSILHFGFWW